MSQKLGKKFYCLEEEVYEDYSRISEISNYVTKNIHEARIFVKPKYINRIIPEERNVMNIFLSAMFWENYDGRGEIAKMMRKDCYRICYATHNSFEEIRDFLLYLRPKKIYPNVMPGTIKERYEMQARIREIQKSYMDDEQEKPKKKFSFKRKTRQNNDADDQIFKRSKN